MNTNTNTATAALLDTIAANMPAGYSSGMTYSEHPDHETSRVFHQGVLIGYLTRYLYRGNGWTAYTLDGSLFGAEFSTYPEAYSALAHHHHNSTAAPAAA